METYSVWFVQQKPGGTKRVPVLTPGIEVVDGVVVNGPAVALGNQNGHYWEVPLMKGNLPQVVTNHSRDMVLDCHPVPNREREGRFFLAHPRHESNRILLRVNTEAGEADGASGAVLAERGWATQVGYGYRINNKGVRAIDLLVDIGPDTVLTITAGGTGQGLFQKYSLEYDGGSEPVIRPVAQTAKSMSQATLSPKPVVANGGGNSNGSREVKIAKAVTMVVATPAPVKSPNGKSEEVEEEAELLALANSAGGRRAGTTTVRPR